LWWQLLLKSLEQVLAWKSGHKVPLLPPSHPLQAILLGELVGCGSLLEIVMAIWRFF
jgi:hypothetical protein